MASHRSERISCPAETGNAAKKAREAGMSAAGRKARRITKVRNCQAAMTVVGSIKLTCGRSSTRSASTCTTAGNQQCTACSGATYLVFLGVVGILIVVTIFFVLLAVDGLVEA